MFFVKFWVCEILITFFGNICTYYNYHILEILFLITILEPKLTIFKMTRCFIFCLVSAPTIELVSVISCFFSLCDRLNRVTQNLLPNVYKTMEILIFHSLWNLRFRYDEKRSRCLLCIVEWPLREIIRRVHSNSWSELCIKIFSKQWTFKAK